MIGQTLAHYRVTAALGAGGMGEVYRATDTKLNREVAIKVLPPEVAEDEERLARFQREAQLLAALNHPNIAAIYGLEEADGKPFLALELVEGEDLKERLEKGPIPAEEALEIARQIAEALEEAHARGIVHRDLKPANVKLTPDGKVKVLDFGLAKAWSGDPASGASSMDLSQSPTLARTGTLAGVILGTAAYMSPEQAAGKAVDKRADIWSFGVVLFEMLTGQSLFTGETASEVMASVIKEEPAWERLPEQCPRPVSKLLRRCLRKKPRERLQDMGDARIELTDALEGADVDDAGDAASSTAGEGARRRQRWERGAWAVATLALAGLAAMLATRGGPPPPVPSGVVRADLPLPPGQVLAEAEPPEISPDGRHLALVLQQRGGPAHLWLHSLETRAARLVPDTEGATSPFWAPDSQSVAFARDGRLQAVRVGDGVVQPICTLPGPRFTSGDWSEEGLIVFSSAGPGDRWGTGYSLYTVSARGGQPQPLAPLDEARGENRHVFPRFLPGETQVVFLVTAEEAENEGVHVLRLDAPAERVLWDPPQVGSQSVRWAHAGARPFLFYQQGGTLLAQPFDPASLELTGDPTPLADRVASFVAIKLFSVSNSGTVVQLPMLPAAENVRLTWFDRSGQDLQTMDLPAPPEQFALSPDGTRVVVDVRAERGRLWFIDTTRGLATRATFDDQGGNPVWSPDGRELVYNRGCNGRNCLLRVALGSGEEPVPVVESEHEIYPEAWTSDDTLVYLEGPLANRAVRTLSLREGGEPELLLQTGFGMDETQVSPDGHWLAYLSDDSGQMEVYLRPFRRPGERVRVSPRGGGQPKWRSDGGELYYVSGDGWLTAVEIQTEGDALQIGTPSPLFEVSPVGTQDALMDLYAPAPDGQRFLVAAPERTGPVEPLHLTLNWPALVE